MILLDKARTAQLLQLAHERFDPTLPEAEAKVLRDSASSLDLPESSTDAQPLPIRPEFVRWLATDPTVAPHIDSKGLRFVHITLPGDLDLRGCHVLVPLTFFQCVVQGEIILQFAETRSLFILNSSVDGGLFADLIVMHGTLFLHKSKFSGPVRLLHAQIASNLNCSGAKLCVTEGYALSADAAEIGGGVFLREGFESTGAIRLPGAQVKNDLDCNSAKLLVTRGDALSAHGAKIGGNVFLNGDFESTGAIRLHGAQIAGQLGCEDAKLLVTEGVALSAEGARIGGNVFLRKGFESLGPVSLRGAHIEGALAFLGATIGVADCTNLCLAGDLIWMGVRSLNGITLSLVGAKVKNLRDDRGSWPEPGKLLLDGLIYEQLTLHKPPTAQQIGKFSFAGELPLDSSERIEWLILQPSLPYTKPQPWMQLSKHLEARGDRKGAKHVLYKLRCLQAQERTNWFLPLWWAIFFAWLEEAPGRIVYSITLTLVLGWLVFGNAGAKGALAPTDAAAYEAFTTGRPMPAAYPVLNPFIYTLENALPLVKLGQDDKWAPDRRHAPRTPLTGYWFLMWSRWILILSGWFQATVLAAALSDRFKQ